MSFMIFPLASKPGSSRVPGKCAHCGGDVWESLLHLDDVYAVWAGSCPHCQQINLLTTKRGRGYTSRDMTLVKPTPEEIAEYPELVP